MILAMTNSSDDPFARVGAELKSGSVSKPAAPRDAGVAVLPVPTDAPSPLNKHKTHGTPVARWAYKDHTGRLLGFAVRFDKADGGKDVLPLTLRRDGGRLFWAWKAFPDPRPLYGLQQLAERPGAPVLAVEGEKTCDAAAGLFPGYVPVTWPGGSKAAGKADWSPLKGRDVVIWPDADEAGRKAAHAVQRLINEAGAETVGVVEVPTYLPPGWDLADEWPDGFGVDQATAALDDAARRARPTDVEWPWGFRMEDDGLWYDQPAKDGATIPTRLSASFEVLAEAREEDGSGWAVMLRFADRDGRQKTFAVSRSRLAGGGAEVRAELAGAGLIVSPARGKADKFSIALAEVRCSHRMVLVSATGWCGGRYVLPGGRVIGPVGGEAVHFTGEARALHYGQSGSLEAWKAGVAARAAGNSLLTFALACAFVGPLLRHLELEGGGVHFRGASSCGKTTLALAGGSVWGGGGPLGFGQTWRSTANALEMVAHGHNDCLAVFDELALVAPEEAGSAAYSLASGQSKARARADGSLRRRSEWRIFFISTGEIALADHIRASRKGDRPMAGQELRLLDIAADAGQHMGIWENIHGHASPAALSDAVKASCASHYGHAGPAFLQRLISDQPAAIAMAKALLAAFLARAAEAGDSGQVQRAAVRFGLAAAAGELAAAFGVVPWPPEHAATVALAMYRRWAAEFGRDAPREDREILRLLRAVIQSERSAFSPIGDDHVAEDALPSAGGRDSEARGLRTYGWRHVRGPEVHYYFHGAGWAQVFRGYNAQDCARVVADAGFLEVDSDKRRLQKSVKINGERQRVYSVRLTILEADLGD